MNLDLIPRGNSEEDLIQILKLLAIDLEHKFHDQPYNITPEPLQEILRYLQNLKRVTRRHSLLNKVNNLTITITAAIRYYINKLYEEFYIRVGVIIDQLKDLDEKIQ